MDRNTPSALSDSLNDDIERRRERRLKEFDVIEKENSELAEAVRIMNKKPASSVTADEFERLAELYDKYGNWEGVGKRLRRNKSRLEELKGEAKRDLKVLREH